MHASVRWLNDLFSGLALPAAEIEALLTDAGFPIESRQPGPSGDTILDVEITSNRGDCLSHLGLAREIAAKTGRELKLPQSTPRKSTGAPALTLDNQVPDACPRFTARLITGVTVGPSPAWLSDRLAAVGQRSINNIVDITNFINFELGHPCHAFDYDRLAGSGVGRASGPPSLIVRAARAGESLRTLDGKERKLHPTDIVVADSTRPLSLAGIIGGADSEVSSTTRNIVLELATWDPVAVRRAARRHQLRTDASHRFERYVDPRTLDYPAARAAALILDLAGGQLSDMLDAGSPPKPLPQITLRPARITQILGAEIPKQEITTLLTRVGVQVQDPGPWTKGLRTEPPPQSSALSPQPFLCTIPPHRSQDLTREIDLVEEIARLRGLSAIPAHDRIPVQPRPPQPTELALRELGTILAGLGFFETVTFSFISPEQARPFLPAGAQTLSVADERRRGEGALRPSLIPSLLLCRRANHHAGARMPGGIRLFETASSFAEPASPAPSSSPAPRGTGLPPAPHPSLAPASPWEHRTLALALDLPGATPGRSATIDERQTAIRILRGALETLAARLTGQTLSLAPAPPANPPTTAWDHAAFAGIYLAGIPVGNLGIVAPATQKLFDLDIPIAAAELALAPLLAAYPPAARIQPLPAFPDIERDLSLIVDEAITWEQVHTLVAQASLEKLEGSSFVASYRGKQTGPGKKSLTLRLRFRDPTRTLRHEEVDPQVQSLVAVASDRLGATLRA